MSNLKTKISKTENLLFFLVILFLPTQLGRHFWPSFSLIYSLPVDYLSPTLYLWDLCVVALMAAFLLQRKKFNLKALNVLLIFLLTQLISLIPLFSKSETLNLGVGLVRLEQYLLAGCFGLYIASSKVKLEKVQLPLATAMVFESILGIGQFLNAGSIGFWIFGERSFTISTPGIAKFDYLGNDFLRPYATLPHPNLLAAFLLISILLLNLRSERIYKVASMLAGITIFLTVSRVAIVLLLFILVAKFGKKYLKQLILMILILGPVLYARFSSVINYDNLSLVRREELIGNAFNYFVSSPLFGIGLNNFIPYVSSDLIAGPSKFLQPVHNIFLLALSETGIIGVLGWVVLLWHPIKNLKSQMSNVKFIWMFILILGLFDHYFLTLAQGYRLLFLVWGLALV